MKKSILEIRRLEVRFDEFVEDMTTEDKRMGELVPGKVAQLVIKVTNPTNTGTTLEFLTLSKLRELKDADKEQEKEDKPVSAINPLRQPSIVTAVDQSVGLATAQIALPASKVGTIMV